MSPERETELSALRRDLLTCHAAWSAAVSAFAYAAPAPALARYEQLDRTAHQMMVAKRRLDAFAPAATQGFPRIAGRDRAAAEPLASPELVTV